MKHKTYQLIRLAYIVLDIFFIGFSIYLACRLRPGKLPFPVTVQNLFFDYHNPFGILFYFSMLCVLFLNHLNGLYRTQRGMLGTIEIWQIIKSVFYAAIMTMMVIYLLKIKDFPRSISILTLVFIIVFLSAWRLFKRLFLEHLIKKGYNNFNVLIVGAGNIGVGLAKEIERRPGLGFRIAGYLDDGHLDRKKAAGHPVLGRIEDFPTIVRREFINKVFITIHDDSRVFLQMLEQARELKIAVSVVPQGFEFMTGDFSKYNIGFIPVLEYCEEEHRFKQLGKRLFDFIIALALIVVFLPVFAAIAIGIKWDSPGPVVYKSRRYGCRGKIFHMYKFRSMEDQAERRLARLRHKNEADGPIFKMRNDPRVTRLGKFLRKWSLDELPQIWNVLKGDMSLVGPRPFPIDQIEKDDMRQLKRLDVRPGITGMWQIRGRSDISFDRLLKWDIWYINNWSLWLDLTILFKTIPIVVKGEGAY